MARPKRPPRTRMSLRIPSAVARELKTFARKHGRELSDVVTHACTTYFALDSLDPVKFARVEHALTLLDMPQRMKETK